MGPEVAQLAQRRRVEGARLHPLGPEPAQPAPHLTGRTRGESDGEHLGRRVDPGGHAVGDAVGDRPGLARAGAGEHPDRPAQRLGHLPLLGVEAREELGGIGQGNISCGWTVESRANPISGPTITLDAGGDTP